MGALGHSSLATLLREENALDVVSMCRTTEDDDWQARYKQLLAAVTVDDFELRESAVDKAADLVAICARPTRA